MRANGFHGPGIEQNCVGMRSSCDSGPVVTQAIQEDSCWTLIGRGLDRFPEIELVNYEIHDTIGNCDNLRIIFYVPPFETNPPTLWVLSVFQKKRDDFSGGRLATLTCGEN